MRKGCALFLALALFVSIFATACKRDPVEETPGYIVTPGDQDVPPVPDEGVIPAIEFMNWTFENEAERDGYTLIPTHFNDTGICTSTSFLLTTPSVATLQEGGGAPSISIDGQPEPIIAREDESTFRVTPSEPLSYNSLYIVRLSHAEGEDTTWAFQTTFRLQVIEILPHHQSTKVPVNTGIEVTFSLDGFTPVDEFFSIFPEVAGRFTSSGNTSVFMPTEPLDFGEFYTVTIKAGITVKGTHEVITEDLVFSFVTETEPDYDSRQDRQTAQVHFFSTYLEYPSFETPKLNYRINYDPNEGRPQIEASIYQFGTANEAVDAIERLINIPYWASAALERRQVDTSMLRKIDSFDITRTGDNDWFETITLPKSLPPGFYLLNVTVRGRASQVILQITDIAVQVVADDERAIVWVNDMSTGKPLVGATVLDPASGRSFSTDGNGIAMAEGSILQDKALNKLVVRADTRENIVMLQGAEDIMPFRIAGYDKWWRPQIYPDDDYWSILEMDRALFRRDDTLHFWGFAVNRFTGAHPHNVAAVVTSIYWRLYDTDDTPHHRQMVPVKDGSYSGDIDLPYLDPGSYRLTIYDGDVVLSTTYFEVQDFKKPPYKLTVSADRRAVFIGESVNFTASAEFFEGTPVAGLDVSYGLWGWQLHNDRSGSGVTDADGLVNISSSEITVKADGQGMTYLGLTVEATLPEIGWTVQQEYVDVFINDLEVRADAVRTGKDASLSVEVDRITLDRLNDETAKNDWDYIDGPDAGRRLEVDIVKIWWEAIRTGEEYDYITRTVTPTYRYKYREQVIDSFELLTDSDGKAGKDFTVPDNEKESYVARVRTTCGFGRIITHDVYIGRDWSYFYGNAWDNEMFLDGARPWGEGYSIGEDVSLTLMRGEEEVTTGNVLFVVANMGIVDYQVGKNTLEFPFSEKHMPGATIHAIFFNGHTYHSGWQMTEQVIFNREDRKLDISVSIGKESFRPGEMATMTVTTKDPDGNPKPAKVNISVVDEALFALREQFTDTLADLYKGVSPGIVINHASHRTFTSVGIDDEYLMAPNATAPDSAPVAEPDPGGNPLSNEDTYLREKFEDTAHFHTVTTNEHGEARLSFRLPDNITSWKLTASGVTTDYYAGNTTENIKVTTPMFLNYSLNNVFLDGDIPQVGITVYGTDLTGQESISFSVWDEKKPENKLTAKGAPFERVNIPLWKMAEPGAHAIVIHAETDSGLSDAVLHPYHILKSHQTADTAVFYDVTEDTVFEAGRPGLTDITFSDRGRGQFLWQLMGMRCVRGERIEGLAVRREADRLIRHYFPDLEIYYTEVPFDPGAYQKEDGGIAIRPYASSNLELSVTVLPFIRDEINLHALRGYFMNKLSSSTGESRIVALYGLAQLGAPVMQDLYTYARAENLSVRDASYLALGLLAIGERHRAAELFDEHIKPNLQDIAPYYRIRDDLQLRDTSLAALLTRELGMPEREGLHRYTQRHEYDDLLTQTDRLVYISREIATVNQAAAGITYTMFGQSYTQDLSGGRHFTLRIPTANLHEFEITGVTGAVGAVSVHSVPLDEVEIVDNDITVRRQFFAEGSRAPATTFNEGDLVRVELVIDYTRKALTGSYMVTDFLPSGLVFVQESARIQAVSGIPRRRAWAISEGQLVIFFDYNNTFSQTRSYYYYARVINPGTFTAEGAIVQNLDATGYLSVGEPAVIRIT